MKSNSGAILGLALLAGILAATAARAEETSPGLRGLRLTC